MSPITLVKIRATVRPRLMPRSLKRLRPRALRPIAQHLVTRDFQVFSLLGSQCFTPIRIMDVQAAVQKDIVAATPWRIIDPAGKSPAFSFFANNPMFLLTIRRLAKSGRPSPLDGGCWRELGVLLHSPPPSPPLRRGVSFEIDSPFSIDRSFWLPPGAWEGADADGA